MFGYFQSSFAEFVSTWSKPTSKGLSKLTFRSTWKRSYLANMTNIVGQNISLALISRCFGNSFYPLKHSCAIYIDNLEFQTSLILEFFYRVDVKAINKWAKLQNTWPLLCISLNNKSACFKALRQMWMMWPGILKLLQ